MVVFAVQSRVLDGGTRRDFRWPGPLLTAGGRMKGREGKEWHGEEEEAWLGKGGGKRWCCSPRYTEGLTTRGEENSSRPWDRVHTQTVKGKGDGGSAQHGISVSMREEKHTATCESKEKRGWGTERRRGVASGKWEIVVSIGGGEGGSSKIAPQV